MFLLRTLMRAWLWLLVPRRSVHTHAVARDALKRQVKEVHEAELRMENRLRDVEQRVMLIIGAGSDVAEASSGWWRWPFAVLVLAVAGVAFVAHRKWKQMTRL